MYLGAQNTSPFCLLVMACRICKKNNYKKVRKKLEKKKTYLRLKTRCISSPPPLSLSFGHLLCCTCCQNPKPILLSLLPPLLRAKLNRPKININVVKKRKDKEKKKTYQKLETCCVSSPARQLGGSSSL